MIQQLLMTAMAVTALVRQPELGWPLASFMVGIVFMLGVSTMWMIGKQAAADIAVRGFAMIGKGSKPFDKLISKDSVEATVSSASDR